jgi:hypothetical protein
VLQIYTWEKTRTPYFPNTDFEKAVKKVYEDAKKTAPHHFGADHAYKQIDTNLLAKKQAPDRLVEIDTSLVSKSVNGFSTDYAYNNLTGARPLNPARK